VFTSSLLSVDVYAAPVEDIRTFHSPAFGLLVKAMRVALDITLGVLNSSVILIP